MTLRTGERLGPYEILAPLGAGGMGEVYRARDTRLGREVAVKVLPEHLSASPELRLRFEQEAKAIAALSHPNILAIHDFATHEDIAYAVMELLEGETLRVKLDAGPIPRRQAVDYALQIAKGLSAAHEKGVIHRDLKPENLFVQKDGHVKILDFGLAKRFEAVGTGEETKAPTVPGHTEPGTLMGTPGYMSPEQVRRLPVDHRSDVFSLGAILYEMLSGKRAFRKETESDTMAAILRDEPPELSGSGRNISPALDNIIRHCLEKDRDNRFQSAKDIVFALAEPTSPTVTSGELLAAPRAAKRMALIACTALVALAVAGIFLLRQPHKASGNIGGVKRLAVLPFENLGSPEDDYFADGMADTVRGKLTSLPGVEVIARGSSTPYKNTKKTLNQIAHELGTTYLLTATVRWEKTGGTSRVQVSPELVEVKESGAATSKWQQPFDAALTDVFQVQSDIATRVAQALDLALGANDEKLLAEKPTQNLAAYDSFLKGEETSRSLAINDPVSLRQALGFYEQAVALDPAFAHAWAQISKADSILYGNSVPTPELAERARQAAEKALALAPDRPDGYLALGTYMRVVVADLNRALEQYAEGRRVAPGNADLIRATALTEQNLGHWDAAVGHFKQAERLDPRSINNKWTLGIALLRLRRYPEAREAFDRGLALAPTNLTLIEQKAMTFLAEGDLAGARAVLSAVPKEVEPTEIVAYLATYFDLVWVLDREQRELLQRLTPIAFDNDRGFWSLCVVQACALNGDAAGVRYHAEEARKAFEQQLRAAPEDAQLHAQFGLALAYLGRRDEAIREGERGVALLPVTRDAYLGPYLEHQLARIEILVDEPERAIDHLERLVKIPYVLSPGWLKIDPNFDPLRKNPRFQRLVEGS